MARGLALRTLSWDAAAVHVGYLLVLLAVGASAAVVTFARKLRA